MLRVSTNDKKYTVILDAKGQMEVLRHGQPWMTNDEMVGSKMILTLAQDLEAEREQVQLLQRELTEAKRQLGFAKVETKPQGWRS